MLHDSEVLSRRFLNARSFNRLTRCGYVTVGDVRAATDLELLELNGLSRGSLEHIRRHCPYDPLATTSEELAAKKAASPCSSYSAWSVAINSYTAETRMDGPFLEAGK